MRHCEIRLTEGEMTAESKIETKIKYQNGVLKKNTIWYAPEEKILALYSKEQSHHITIDPLLLKDCLDLFHPKVIDILFECTPQYIIIKTFWDYNNGYQGDKPVQSSFKMLVSQCIEYDVTAPVKLIFNLREFKVILDYMSSMEVPLEAHFEEPGRPILFDYRQNNEIIAEFALNTQNNFAQENTPLNDHSVGSIETSAYESRHAEEPSESSIDLDADTEPESRLPSRRLVRHIPSTSSSVQLSDSEEESRKKRRMLGRQDDIFFEE
ncbi:Rad9-domain-containing protein [Sporodiniella umbellata]|nr:Rad9-domain-containing protein [Sporodiniella umbellata]